MPRKAKVELWQAGNEKWYFHKVAGNGENVGHSQGYSTKSNAKRAIRRECPGLKIVEVVS